MQEEDLQQIYLDTDDDIVGIIGKIESAEAGGAALIPPKRSTALQSVVNLKLLKKAAAGVDKKIVIITKDPNILNVASQLKLLVAPNLDTQAQVPEPKASSQNLPSSIIDGSQISEKDFDSADSAASKLDNEDGKGKKNKSKKPRKSRGKGVPDFDRFKKIILFSILGVILLGLGVWGLFGLLPAADVYIDGRTQNVSTDFTFGVDTEVEASDIEEGVLAAELREINRTLTTDFEATGEKTVGEKATGEVELVNCFDPNGVTIPSGTAIVDPNDLIYYTNESVTISGYSGTQTCSSEKEVVSITADQIGPNYNKEAKEIYYDVGDYSSENIYAEGGVSPISGGSEEKVSVVSSSDIADTRDELLEEERISIRDELAAQFDEDMYVIANSFKEDVTDTESDPEENEEAKKGRLIIQVTYSLLAVSQDDFLDLIEHRYIAEAADDTGLVAIDYGLDSVNISSTSEDREFRARAQGILGPDIDLDSLRETLAGMAYTEAIDNIESRANITRAQIDISPFWAGSLPKNPDKINIEFEVAGLDDSEDEEGNESETEEAADE
ncbi:MAG: hypothetical protein WD061_01755 [Candidatus Saccharimonadales bacterium]